MDDLYVVLIGIGLMFGVVFGLWSIWSYFESKKIDKELKGKYGENWKDKFRGIIIKKEVKDESN